MKDTLLNKEITVQGTAVVGWRICTLIMCPHDQTCCNSCSGNLMLSGDGNITLTGSWNGTEIGCGGTECALTCSPLEEGKQYRVTGTWKSSQGEYALELKNFEEIR